MKDLVLSAILMVVTKVVIQQEFFLIVMSKEQFIKTNYELFLEKASEIIILDEEIKAAILKRITDTVNYMETGQCTCDNCLAEISKPASDNISSPSNT